jgi:hypothetical protein
MSETEFRRSQIAVSTFPPLASQTWSSEFSPPNPPLPPHTARGVHNISHTTLPFGQRKAQENVYDVQHP